MPIGVAARTGLWTCVLGLSLFGCAGREPVSGTVREDVFASRVASEDFTILVRTPPSYEASGDSKYPVIYQLDATFLDEFDTCAATVSRLEEEGAIPESIIVGIGHLESGPDLGREHDFVPADPDNAQYDGRADKFYAFLHDELVPHVESTYRVAPGRALVGHSLGGLFALYAFFQEDSNGQPFFDKVLAADPSYGANDGVIFAFEEERSALSRSRPGRLFLTASLYTGGAQAFPHAEMTHRIRTDFDDLELESTYEPTDHGGLIQLSMEKGLPFLLEESSQ
ncbi:MAG: alpha/beta hydrolase-fold protein [Polyangiaceae bacterium]